MATRWSWWRVPASLTILLAAGCVAACTHGGSLGGGDGGGGAGGGGHAAGPAIPRPAWQAVALPVGGPGRAEVRDLAACSGHWYAAGGYLMPDASTRPALWTSPDARTWAQMPIRPKSFYGPGQLLSAVACRGDEVVAVGSTPGGAHGNPRISTWASGGDGLNEVPAPFELYGGTDAIGTGRLTAGPTGWLITGTRRDANGQAGAAVWFSADGRTFRLVDADPALESDARGLTTALDAAAGASGFTAVGTVLTPGSRTGARDPAVWTSSDGLAWRRQPVPATPQDETLDRAVPYRDGVLAVGERESGFGAWFGAAGGWRATGRFGAFAGTNVPLVNGLAVGADQRAYAIAGDGTRYRLWASPDAVNWTELALPAAVPATGQNRVSLVGTGGQLLLVAEDGTSTRLWTAAG
jgi:hypothetical protein